jgi:hypothetical protein
MTQDVVPALATAAVTLLGLSLAALGVILIVQDRRTRARASHASGTVVDHVYGPGHVRAGQSIPPPPAAFNVGSFRVQPEPRVMTYLLVEFTTGAGRTIRFRSSQGSRPPDHEIGARVPVYYDASDPERARIVGEGRFLWIVLIVFGLLLAAIGGGLSMIVRAA